MIIWGWRGRQVERERGHFHCPQCDASQGYKRLRVSTYFTLYFIPIFETTHHGDVIECLRCAGQFDPAVLHYTPPSLSERMVAAVRADLESGTPLEMARTKMTNAGIAGEVAEQTAAAACGDPRRSCPNCRLTFIASIEKCSSCSGSLVLDRGYSPLGEPVLMAEIVSP
jgi:hypothetical protein